MTMIFTLFLAFDLITLLLITYCFMLALIYSSPSYRPPHLYDGLCRTWNNAKFRILLPIHLLYVGIPQLRLYNVTHACEPKPQTSYTFIIWFAWLLLLFLPFFCRQVHILILGLRLSIFNTVCGGRPTWPTCSLASSLSRVRRQALLRHKVTL